MWLNYGTPKKNLAGLVKMVIKYVSNFGQWWYMTRSFSGIINTTSIAQSVAQPSWHKKSHTVSTLFTYKRTMTVMGIRL